MNGKRLTCYLVDVNRLQFMVHNQLLTFNSQNLFSIIFSKRLRLIR